VTNQLQPHEWTFLSNHSHVLYCISFWPDIRIRDIALKVRITERAVQRIVVDLERGGYLKRERVGRKNQYRLEPKLHLRHPLEHHVKVGRLLTILHPGIGAKQISEPRPHGTTAVTTRGLRTAARPKGKAASGMKKGTKKARKLTARKTV